MSKMNKSPMSYVKAPVEYDSWGTYIYDADHKMIADVRGWGWIQSLPTPERIQDGIGQFIVDAINEKLEREKQSSDLVRAKGESE